MFTFGIVLIVLGVIFAFVFLSGADSSYTSDDEATIYRIIAVFCVLICLIGVLICNFTYEPPLCPECHTEVSTYVRYCNGCGYELIPHCDVCGEVCRTAFCALCGAEQ